MSIGQLKFHWHFRWHSLFWSHHLVVKQRDKIGAGGGTRTRTTVYGPKILSPVRLPFRHTGYLDSIDNFNASPIST